MVVILARAGSTSGPSAPLFAIILAKLFAIQVVSPGNKAGKKAVREFVLKAVDFLRRGINLLIVDPFPPGAQDPQTLHKLIWDQFDEGVPFELPADEPLLLASYRAATPLVEFTLEAFIEPLGVGAQLPDMPAWLGIDLYVNVPLSRPIVRPGRCARLTSDNSSSKAYCRTRACRSRHSEGTAFIARVGLFRDKRLVSVAS